MSDKLIPDDIDAIIEGHKNAKPEDLPKQIEYFMGQLWEMEEIARGSLGREEDE